MSSSEAGHDHSLAQHLEALYALARVLAGSDEASALIKTVYERAAEVPPLQRPADKRGWLFRLMVKAREDDLHPAGAEVHPTSDTSFTDDPFRREVAKQTAERRLPVAFAACSIHERFILAIDVLGEPSDEVLAAALDTSTTNARSIRDQARSALRASLRDVLKGPERMVVDVALPDEVLRDHLRNLLVDRFHPAPPPLQSDVTAILERARAERQDDSSRETYSLPGVARLRGLWRKGLDALRTGLSLRGLIGALVFLTVVTAGIGGASYLFSSSSAPSSSQTVVDLSVQQSSGIRTAFETETPSRASAYIHQTWDRRVSVPTIEGASLKGVGRLSLSMGTDVPALLYVGEKTGSEIVAFAYNYALIDELGRRATLTRDRRTKLATNAAPLAETRSDRAVVLWRQRDDLFVIVTSGLEADTLRSRIRL